MLKLESLRLRDFRSISGEWEVPLDANVVLIHGANGAGKTSLLSALELAATGGISYLDRLSDDGYRRHLHHRGTKSGQITLRTSGLRERNVGSASLTEAGADCEPLLDGPLAETFVERCFLPQATLSRLFEVYAPKDARDADTPLIRFVKEVLGLDALDALIDGLHPAGDIRRIRNLSRGWQGAEDRRDALERTLRNALQVQSTAQSRADALTADLVARVGLEEPSDDSQIQTAVGDVLEARDGYDETGARLRQAALRLDAVELTLVQEQLITVDPNEPEDDSGLAAAEARFRDWSESRSRPLRQWFTSRASQGASEESDPDPQTMLRALRREIEDVEASLDEAERKRTGNAQIDERAAVVRGAVADIDREIADLADERDIASSGSAAAALASTLVGVLEHIDGESCPVCDQHFRGAGPLREHVIAKVGALNSDAARLVAMENRRSQLDSRRNALVRELEDLGIRRQQIGDVRALTSEVQARTAQLRNLRALEPIGDAGRLLTTEIARIRDVRAMAARSRKLLDRCLADLSDIAQILGVTPPRGLLAQQVAALRASAQADLEEVTSQQHRVSEVLRLQEALDATKHQLLDAAHSVAAVEADLARLDPHVAEARRRKEVASRLRRSAEELRTATTTRVFDERLNGSWARIFGALVPSEPFVPQFKPIPAGSRQVTVDIETLHRDGLEGAAPAAMLSQGNLNTAALSLFVALHFAVAAQLPWLVFDDPVQSMDDLHVSNFAAMVKQLTRRHDRQIVVAVHERDLFEYLALELTPASPGEEVIKIVLDRTYGRTVLTHDRLQYREDTALTPSPAA
ncbi:hypothetical protein D0Z08_19400 [Nocardioides immobilis]|uniref:Nuclease SbcCD subunit C n=1 Tax=Nocardioides immobilis TaxID=2049295 RepID=A0A417XYF0_9ACTN|nr:AAA family ATPase [Nocardioides immobilis]RHW25396.1 hypothetical protein D0Z08_19400 [Nocardioides immobilis]